MAEAIDEDAPRSDLVQNGCANRRSSAGYYSEIQEISHHIATWTLVLSQLKYQLRSQSATITKQSLYPWSCNVITISRSVLPPL